MNKGMNVVCQYRKTVPELPIPAPAFPNDGPNFRNASFLRLLELLGDEQSSTVLLLLEYKAARDRWGGGPWKFVLRLRLVLLAYASESRSDTAEEASHGRWYVDVFTAGYLCRA